MNTLRLITREIRHRPGTFVAGALLVTFAVVSVLGAIGMLRVFDTETERITGALEDETRVEMAKLEDEIRKSMKGLGFNIFIYPKGQAMSEVFEKGFATKTMPEEYVHRLANSKIVTVNHLLPRLTTRLKWEEYQRAILLIGIKGQVPFAHRDPKKPIMDPVEPGDMVIGSELSQSLDLAPGDSTTLLGRDFTISKVHAERGTIDDITVWINLAEAQELLGKPGQITSILALECNCESIDRLGEIRAELGAILPGVQIIEKQSRALARAEARNQAQRTAEAQLQRTRSDRAALRQEREGLLSVLLPLLVVAAMAGVALLTMLNVRARWSEIGILRAIGVRSGKILTTILGKSALIGMAGALSAAVLLVLSPYRESLQTAELLAAALLAPFLALVAGWLPALIASQRDPSLIIRHD